MHSHVFPEFFYGPTYDESHRFISVSSHPWQKTKPFETGLREYLLCKECEQQFSRHETYAASIFRKTEEYRTPDGRALEIPDFDYLRFKLFGLSLIWRAHISKLHMFGGVNLGPHAEKIRAMLVTEKPGEPSKYCFTLIKIEGVKIADTIIHAPERVRFRKHIAYFFLAYGYEWIFIISSHSNELPEEYPFVGMKPELVILIQKQEEKSFIHEVRRRMGDKLIEKTKRAT
jgi:hypothetical protein